MEYLIKRLHYIITVKYTSYRLNFNYLTVFKLCVDVDYNIYRLIFLRITNSLFYEVYEFCKKKKRLNTIQCIV